MGNHGAGVTHNAHGASNRASATRAARKPASNARAARVAEVAQHDAAARTHGAAARAPTVSVADAHTHETLSAYHARLADNLQALSRTHLPAGELRERQAEVKMLREAIPQVEARLSGAKVAPAEAQPAARVSSGAKNHSDDAQTYVARVKAFVDAVNTHHDAPTAARRRVVLDRYQRAFGHAAPHEILAALDKAEEQAKAAKPAAKSTAEATAHAAHEQFKAARAHLVAMATPGGQGAPTDEIDRLRAYRAAEEQAMRAGWEDQRAQVAANPFGAERASMRAWRGAMTDMQTADKLAARIDAGKPARNALQRSAVAARARVTEAKANAKSTERIATLQARESAAWARVEAANRAVTPLYQRATALRQRADTAMQAELRAHDMSFTALRSGKVVELSNARGERAYLLAEDNGPDSRDRQTMRLSAFSPQALTSVRAQDVPTFLAPSSRNFMRADMGTQRTPWINWPTQKALFMEGGWLPSGKTYASLANARGAALKERQAATRAAKNAVQKAQA